MTLDDVRYHRDLPEAGDEAPEGEREHGPRPAPVMPEFELDDIDW